jgi:hypothetical protein
MPPQEAAAKPRSVCEDAAELPDPTSDQDTTHKAANVSLELDGDLAGLTLCGFSVWDNGAQGLRVSFPTRRFVAASGNRGSFLILRATDSRNRTAYERLKREILDAYHAFAREHGASLSVSEAVS